MLLWFPSDFTKIVQMNYDGSSIVAFEMNIIEKNRTSYPTKIVIVSKTKFSARSFISCRRKGDDRKGPFLALVDTIFPRRIHYLNLNIEQVLLYNIKNFGSPLFSRLSIYFTKTEQKLIFSPSTCLVLPKTYLRWKLQTVSKSRSRDTTQKAGNVLLSC